MNEIKLKITIDGKEAVASLQLTDANVKQLYNSFKYGEKEVSGFTTAISQGFNNAREIIGGAREILSVFTGIFNSQLQSYYAQETALSKLNQALKANGNFSEKNVKTLTDYATQLQKTTVFGDELTIAVMGQLQAMGLSVDMTKRATMLSADLATVMGTDLSASAKVMADLFNGDATMIKRYIKGLDKSIIKSGNASAIIAHLNERIGGQAVAMGETAYGAMQKFNNAVDDVKENTGQLIAQSMQPLVKTVGELISNLNTMNPEIMGAVGGAGALTTAFITLRLTGILPATSSMLAFASSMGVVKSTMIKTGLLALVVALGYGLNELMESYNKWNDAEAAREGSTFEKAVKIDAETKSIAELSKGIEHYTKKIKELEDAKKPTLITADEKKNLSSKDAAKLKISRALKGTADRPGLEEEIKKYKIALEAYKITLEEKKRIDIYHHSDKIKSEEKLYEELLLKRETGEKKEQLQLKLKYDADVKAANGNKKVLLLLEEQYQRDELEVTLKWNRTKIEEEKKFWTSVNKNREEAKKSFEKPMAGVKEDKKEYELFISETDKRFAEIAETIGTNATIAMNNFISGSTFGLLKLVDVTDAFKSGFDSATQGLASAGAESIKIFRNANSVLEQFIETLIRATAQSLIFKAVNSLVDLALPGIGSFLKGIFAANGAVVTRPTLAVVGEGGEPEGVFPLSYLDNMMSTRPQVVYVQMEPVELKARGMDLRSVIKQTEHNVKKRR
jgi:hypothetical protein